MSIEMKKRSSQQMATRKKKKKFFFVREGGSARDQCAASGTTMRSLNNLFLKRWNQIKELDGYRAAPSYHSTFPVFFCIRVADWTDNGGKLVSSCPIHLGVTTRTAQITFSA